MRESRNGERGTRFVSTAAEDQRGETRSPSVPSPLPALIAHPLLSLQTESNDAERCAPPHEGNVLAVCVSGKAASVSEMKWKRVDSGTRSIRKMCKFITFTSRQLQIRHNYNTFVTESPNENTIGRVTNQPTFFFQDKKEMSL